MQASNKPHVGYGSTIVMQPAPFVTGGPPPPIRAINTKRSARRALRESVAIIGPPVPAACRAKAVGSGNTPALEPAG